MTGRMEAGRQGGVGAGAFINSSCGRLYIYDLWAYLNVRRLILSLNMELWK